METLPPGAWAALASVWPRTGALADAWTEVQGEEGTWEKPPQDLPPWGAGSQEGMKLPSAEWAPRWPGSPGLAPRRPAGLMSCRVESAQLQNAPRCPSAAANLASWGWEGVGVGSKRTCDHGSGRCPDPRHSALDTGGLLSSLGDALTPAGPPALHVDLGGQGHELEVWQAPGGVSCDAGAFNTGSPQTQVAHPKDHPGGGCLHCSSLSVPRRPRKLHTPHTGTVPCGNTACDSVLPRAARSSLRVLMGNSWEICEGQEGQGPGCGESRVLALELRHHLRMAARAREGFLCVYVCEGLCNLLSFFFVRVA